MKLSCNCDMDTKANGYTCLSNVAFTIQSVLISQTAATREEQPTGHFKYDGCADHCAWGWIGVRLHNGVIDMKVQQKLLDHYSYIWKTTFDKQLSLSPSKSNNYYKKLQGCSFSRGALMSSRIMTPLSYFIYFFKWAIAPKGSTLTHLQLCLIFLSNSKPSKVYYQFTPRHFKFSMLLDFSAVQFCVKLFDMYTRIKSPNATYAALCVMQMEVF